MLLLFGWSPGWSTFIDGNVGKLNWPIGAGNWIGRPLIGESGSGGRARDIVGGVFIGGLKTCVPEWVLIGPITGVITNESVAGGLISILIVGMIGGGGSVTTSWLVGWRSSGPMGLRINVGVVRRGFKDFPEQHTPLMQSAEPGHCSLTWQFVLPVETKPCGHCEIPENSYHITQYKDMQLDKQKGSFTMGLGVLHKCHWFSYMQPDIDFLE